MVFSVVGHYEWSCSEHPCACLLMNPLTLFWDTHLTFKISNNISLSASSHWAVPRWDESIGALHCKCVCGWRGQPGDPPGQTPQASIFSRESSRRPWQSGDPGQGPYPLRRGKKREKFPRTCLGTSSMDFMAQILFHRWGNRDLGRLSDPGANVGSANS